MKRTITAITIATLAAAAFICATRSDSSAETAPAAIGKITDVRGPIGYDARGTSGYAEVSGAKAKGMEIFSGDMVFSGPSTTGEAEFTYGARVKISADTEMQFHDRAMRIKKGGVWINYKPARDAAGKITFKVATPVGTIGIKGTEFSVNVDPKSGSTEVSVTEGKVGFESDKGFGSADISAGEKLSVATGAPVGKPVPVETKQVIEGTKQILIDYNGDGM